MKQNSQLDNEKNGSKRCRAEELSSLDNATTATDDNAPTAPTTHPRGPGFSGTLQLIGAAIATSRASAENERPSGRPQSLAPAPTGAVPSTSAPASKRLRYEETRAVMHQSTNSPPSPVSNPFQTVWNAVMRERGNIPGAAGITNALVDRFFTRLDGADWIALGQTAPEMLDRLKEKMRLLHRHSRTLSQWVPLVRPPPEGTGLIDYDEAALKATRDDLLRVMFTLCVDQRLRSHPLAFLFASGNQRSPSTAEVTRAIDTWLALGDPSAFIDLVVEKWMVVTRDDPVGRNTLERDLLGRWGHLLRPHQRDETPPFHHAFEERIWNWAHSDREYRTQPAEWLFEHARAQENLPWPPFMTPLYLLSPSCHFGNSKLGDIGGVYVNALARHAHSAFYDTATFSMSPGWLSEPARWTALLRRASWRFDDNAEATVASWIASKTATQLAAAVYALKDLSTISLSIPMHVPLPTDMLFSLLDRLAAVSTLQSITPSLTSTITTAINVLRTMQDTHRTAFTALLPHWFAELTRDRDNSRLSPALMQRLAEDPNLLPYAQGIAHLVANARGGLTQPLSLDWIPGMHVGPERFNMLVRQHGYFNQVSFDRDNPASQTRRTQFDRYSGARNIRSFSQFATSPFLERLLFDTNISDHRADIVAKHIETLAVLMGQKRSRSRNTKKSIVEDQRLRKQFVTKLLTPDDDDETLDARLSAAYSSLQPLTPNSLAQLLDKPQYCNRGGFSTNSRRRWRPARGSAQAFQGLHYEANQQYFDQESFDRRQADARFYCDWINQALPPDLRRHPVDPTRHLAYDALIRLASILHHRLPTQPLDPQVMEDVARQLSTLMSWTVARARTALQEWRDAGTLAQLWRLAVIARAEFQAGELHEWDVENALMQLHELVNHNNELLPEGPPPYSTLSLESAIQRSKSALDAIVTELRESTAWRRAHP